MRAYTHKTPTKGAPTMLTEFQDIQVHETHRLEAILNGIIASREKLTHWPLSYVEKVTLTDNTCFIYKSQHTASSLEKHFYANIKSPYLSHVVYAETYENCDIMLFPYLPYPTLGEVSDGELENIVRQISGIIQTFANMPVFFDLSTSEKLFEIIDSVCTIFDEQEVAGLKNWVCKNAYIFYDNQQIGNVHGDFTTSNILTESGSLKYILDWQRPIKAPVPLEGALAFRLAGKNGTKFGEFELMAILCHFIWFSYAYKKLIPLDGVMANARKLLQEFISLAKRIRHDYKGARVVSS